MITTFDRLLYRIERAVVAAMLAGMGVVVFFDVLHRVSSHAGPLANPVVIGITFTILGTFAVLTRGGAMAPFKGLAIGIAVAAGQQIFVRSLPNGLIWSQPFALALTLWLGLIGASLAAYERRHLALDVGSRLWPAWLAPKVSATGHFVTAATCLFLLWLGVRSILGYELDGREVAGHYAVWRESEGAAGKISGVDIPKWVVFLSVPYGMLALAFRFTLQGWRVWTGREALSEDDTLQQLGLAEQSQ